MQNFPLYLISALKSNSLLPLVGAGVSMSVTDKSGKRLFPSWSELFGNAVKEIEGEDAEFISMLVKRNKLLEAAKESKKYLKGERWFQFLTKQFDPNLNECEQNSLALPKAVWGLSSQIITLNYDRVLAHCSGASNTKTITNDVPASVSEMVNISNEKMVWHLHGHVDNLANIVLTPESYHRLYEENEDYKAALQTLKTILASRNLFFVGCSLSDAELLAEMATQHKLFEGNTKNHFVLIHKNDKALIQEKLKNITNIELLTFEDFGSPLVDLINELASHKKPIQEESKISSPNVQNQAGQTNVTPKKQSIAYLNASPIDDNNNHSLLENKLKKNLPFDMCSYPLTINQLQTLPESDYVVLACKIKKK